SVVITDVGGNIEYVNPKFTQLTGYTLSEAMGQNPRILKSGDMNPDEYKSMWDTISSGHEWHGEFHNRKKNGELYWEAASISPVRNAQKKVTHFIAVKEDITERKKVEEALRKSEEDLRIRNDIMEEDLRFAQRVQHALLPSTAPQCDWLSVSFRYKSLDLVGGDYFAFFVRDGSLRVFVGDISGHGVPSALFLSLIRFAAENIESHNGHEPSSFLSELNAVLCQHMQTYFITAMYGVFEKINGEVVINLASGGHPPLLICRKDGVTCESVRGKGGILGVFDDVTFEPKRIALAKGDRIFFYTDGIPETKNEKNEIIGYDRMEDVIISSQRSSLDGTLDAILDEVTRFRGTASVEDDIVLIGCEVR
ncbi:MAG TPA: SpoIIE family protein phosphatase, partial [Spirochaetota bacterium]